MKFTVNDQKCGANKDTCTAIKVCPVNAISYTEADEPITGKTVNCAADSSGCGCDCGDNSSGCAPNLYGRIVIDYDKCIECGVCADQCCGNAIEMVG